MDAVAAPGDAEEIRRVYPRVLAETLALTRRLHDAEDAVHDAVARIRAALDSR